MSGAVDAVDLAGADAGDASAAAPARRPRGEAATVIVAAVIFAALSLACAAASEAFIAADACLHYLYSKFAFDRPTYLVDVWGRPLCTALYALPAKLGGRFAVRATSLLLALACAGAAYGIAAGQGMRRPSLALLFVLAQPLVFLHSFGEMTELPFATVLAFAFWAYQSRRWAIAAALVSLLPLARPEGFGFLVLAAGAFALHRRFAVMFLLPLPLLAWNHAGWALYGRPGPWWRWLVDHWPYEAQSLYSSGHLLHFVALLPVVVAPLALPGTLTGIVRCVSDPLRFFRARTLRDSPGQKAGAFPAHDAPPETASHLHLCQLLTALLPLSVLAGHSVLFWLGKMASFGEPRYLLVVAPLWGVLSARGWEWIFDRLDWRHARRWAVAAALAPLLSLAVVPLLPLRLPDHWHVARAAADHYRAEWRDQGFPRILAAHPGVFYYLGIDPKDERIARPWTRRTVAEAPAGTLLVWDPVYATRNADSDMTVGLERIEAAGWVAVPELDAALAAAGRGHADRFTVDRAEDLGAAGPWRVFRSPRPADPPDDAGGER